MEDKTRALIVTGAVLLLILALIIAAIFYLIRFIQGRQANSTTQTTSQNQINFSPTPGPSLNPQTGSVPQTGTPTNSKTHNGSGFQLSYPTNWGILTCSNSQNVEFDPYNATDQLRVACDYAQKPVTVIVGVSCEGAATQMGGVQVVKSQRPLSKGTEYSWCVKTGGTNLLITNRVSQEEVRGYGKDNQSQAIEQMIARMRVGNAS